MTDTHTFKIGETTFWIDRIAAEPALKIFFDLQAKYLTQMSDVLDIITIMKQTEGDQNTKMAAAVAAGKPFIVNLSQSLTGNDVADLAKMLFVPGTITFAKDGGKPVDLNDATQGMAFKHWFDIIELLAEVARYNFADFLPRFVNLFGKLGGSQANTAKK